MNTSCISSLSGLIEFSSYFGAAVVITAIFCFVYTLITPYSELTLIRKGNTAAAITLGGAILGFTIPLYNAIAHSVSFTDMLIWSAIAMTIQIALFSIIRFILRDLLDEVKNNHTAAAVTLAFSSVSIGIINAACITY